jgi:hypothetical protein
MTRGPSRWWPALLLFLVTLGVFSPVLGHRFLGTWDDPIAIVHNPDYNPPRWRNLVHYWTKPPAKGLFYVPVTYTLWGVVAFVARHSAPAGVPFDPSYFYAINWVAHAASAAMAYLVLGQLVRPAWAAWAGAAVFALHPIQVEAVANAWSMYTPLSAAFAFFAMWQYLRWSDRRRSESLHERSIAWRSYALACLGFALALLTKPTVATVPLMLAAIECGLRGRRLRDVIAPLAPWALAAVFLVWLDQRIPATGRVFVPEAWLRPLVPLDAIAFYLGKLLLPLHLCMDYGRTPWLIAGKPAIRLTWLIVLGMIVGAWAARRCWPIVATAFAVFVAGLIPVIGIVPFTFQYFSTVADRYVYLAMLGPALAVAAVLARLEGRGVRVKAVAGALHADRSGSARLLPSRGFGARSGSTGAAPSPLRFQAIALGGVAILAVLAGLSVLQLRHWKDDWTLAAYTMTVNPRSMAAIGAFQSLFAAPSSSTGAGPAWIPPGRCTLNRDELLSTGRRLAGAGFPVVAADCYREALRLDPNDETARKKLKEPAHDAR